jgi:hypothetical protein
LVATTTATMIKMISERAASPTPRRRRRYTDGGSRVGGVRRRGEGSIPEPNLPSVIGDAASIRLEDRRHQGPHRI